MPTTRTIAAAHDQLACLRRVKSDLALAAMALVNDDDHDALCDVSIPHPIDLLSDVRAAISEREDALRAWLAVHDRDAA